MYYFPLKVMSCGISRCKGGESKWIHLKTVCIRSAAASDSSRRFCSVTAVVCRQFSHMTSVWGWGGLCPSSQCLLFLGKMAAIALLFHMTHMNWCEQENSGSMVMHCSSVTQSAAARPYVAHRRDSECPSEAFIETKFCCVYSVEWLLNLESPV